MDISNELLAKAEACKTVEELVALARENNYELSPEEAELFFQEFGEGEFVEGELADEELDNVAGGQDGCSKPKRAYDRVYFQNRHDVQFFFNIDELVEAYPVGMKNHTASCYVRSMGIAQNNNGYYDVYYLEKRSGSRTPFKDGNYPRDSIENPNS